MSEPPSTQAPAVVTIAALYGAGGARIAAQVAERLGVPFLDRAIPAAVAKRAGLTDDALAEFDEVPRTRSQRLLASLSRAAPPTSVSGEAETVDLQHRRIRGEIEAFLAETVGSGGVILGRGGAVVLA